MMEERKEIIDFISVQSLKTAAVISIAVKLWKFQCSLGLFEDAIIYSTGHKKKYRLGTFDFSCFKVLRKPVLDELFRLPLPMELKREIMPFILPVGRQLLDWMDQEYFNLGYISFDYICWTNEGTINVSETITSIFERHGEDETVFMSISNACLEDHIIRVYTELPDYMKDLGSSRNQKMCSELKYQYHLVIYWLCFCKDEMSKLLGTIGGTDRYNIYNRNHNIQRNMFELSIRTGNGLAAKYFWKKLSVQEKNENFLAWIDELIKHRASDYHDVYLKRNGYSDILYFLLGQMKSFKEQKDIFEKHSEVILKSLIFDWPWHQYLLQTVRIMFPFLDESVFVEFMYDLASTILKDGGEEKLFKEVWCSSPLNFKKSFVENVTTCTWRGIDVFHNLLDNDLETFKLIMNYACDDEKKTFIYACVRSKSFIIFAVCNLDIANDFLRDTLSTEHDFCYCKELIADQVKEAFCACWLHKYDKRSTEAFLKWCFNSEEEVQSLMHKIELERIVNSIRSSKE